MVEDEFAELSRQIQRTLQVEEADLADTDDWTVIQKGIVSRVIREAHAEWAAYAPYELFPAGVGRRLRGECSGQLAKLTLKYFLARGWHAATEDTALLNELAEFYVEKAYIAQSAFSGVVIAGFGRSEFFPVLKRLRLGNIHDGHLKRVEIPTVAISEDKKVHVGIYADSGMADLFLKGISFPALEFVIEHAYLRGHDIALEALALSGVEVTDELWAKVEASRDEILHKLVDEIQDFRGVSSEFERALTHIPKDELASVAASLVNLNSFEKRMSMNLESVGGPVDVAVISKGDGFIWIDRKHYFDADKNPHFVRNHVSIRRGPRRS